VRPPRHGWDGISGAPTTRDNRAARPLQPTTGECGGAFLGPACAPGADYGLAECAEPGYPARTAANARDSDGALWFGDWHSPGDVATLDACRKLGRPFLIVDPGVTRPSQVRSGKG
jgi:hypothetical protein